MKLLKKTKTLSKTVIIIYVLFAVILFRTIIVNALENYGTHYRLDTTTYTTWYKFDITWTNNDCVVVSGTFTGNDIFVPKKTTGEWDRFRRTQTPTYISIKTGIVPACNNNTIHPSTHWCIPGTVSGYTMSGDCERRKCIGNCGKSMSCSTGDCEFEE